MFGMVLAGVIALFVTCYAYAYISVYTGLSDMLVTTLFYAVVYLTLRISLMYCLAL